MRKHLDKNASKEMEEYNYEFARFYSNRLREINAQMPVHMRRVIFPDSERRKIIGIVNFIKARDLSLEESNGTRMVDRIPNNRYNILGL